MLELKIGPTTVEIINEYHTIAAKLTQSSKQVKGVKTVKPFILNPAEAVAFCRSQKL